MLIHSYFIIDIDQYENFPAIQLPENSNLAYRIAPENIHGADTFYRKLFLSPVKNPFCLLLDGSLDFSEQTGLADLLLSFSFHAGYLKTNHDNPIILFETGKPEGPECLSTVREAFKNQGYNDIESSLIPKNNSHPTENINKNFRFDVQEGYSTLADTYINTIKGLGSTDCSCCYFLKFPRELPGILKTIEQADLTIEKEMPQLFSLLRESKFLKTNAQESLAKIELLEEEQESLEAIIANYNSSIVRYKKQVIELVNFYTREYEILPLWFKRAGHIVKVMTGKRNFKSLFDDHAKK